MEEFLRTILDITIKIHLTEMKDATKMSLRAINAEYVDKLIAGLQEQHPNRFTPDQLEEIRQEFLRRTFDE